MTKTKRKKSKYVVGFDGDGQVVYGRAGSGTGEKFVSYVAPMTLFSARRYVKKLAKSKIRACIYELAVKEFR